MDKDNEQRWLARAIEPYRDLLLDLLADRISADDFQTEYFERYLNDERFVPDEIFNVVDRFFAEVDAYVDDERLRDPANRDLGPEELRERAAELLRRAGYDVPE